MTDPGPSAHDVFEALRRRLFGVAYGIVGSVADAEDVVQETWIAWSTVDAGEVRDPESYLVRAVTHRALNSLRSRQRRREDYVGPWLPEPVDTGLRPEDAATQADDVTFALMVLLEQLSPLERAAFVLREVFDLSTDEVAESLERSPAAIRQLVSRARGHLQGVARYDTDATEQRRLGRVFVDAIRTGDLSRVMSVVAPDVVLVTDGGGQVQAALRPIQGADNVLRFFAGLALRYPDWAAREAVLNGLPSLLITAGDTVSAVHLGIVDGIVTDVWVVRNPEKLTGLQRDRPHPACSQLFRDDNVGVVRCQWEPSRTPERDRCPLSPGCTLTIDSIFQTLGFDIRYESKHRGHRRRASGTPTRGRIYVARQHQDP